MELEEPLIVFVVNPISGGKQKANLIKRIPALMEESGYRYEVWQTQYANHATELTKQAIEAQAYAVIAVGGDGTMNEVATALIGSNVFLGIVPLGSGNGLVRHLGIPLRPEEAIQAFRHSIPVPLDACIVGEHHFFCAAGMGYDAEVAQRFNQGGPRGLIRYLWEATFTFFHYKPKTYSISIEGQGTKKLKAVMITFCNASQLGNNAYLAPDALCNDGLLDIVVLLPFPFWRTPELIISLFTGKLLGHPNMLHLKGKKGVITREDLGPIHYDGETAMAPKDLEISILPAAIQILVPKGD